MAIGKSVYSAKDNELHLTLATFGNWWNDLKGPHKFLIRVGILLVLAGGLDMIAVVLGLPSLLFWANDLFFIFGGTVLIVAGISYALRSEE